MFCKAGLRPCLSRQIARHSGQSQTPDLRRRPDMDQTIGIAQLDPQHARERLTQFVAASVDAARTSEAPFFHLEFDRVFPDDVYAQMLELMPQSEDYRPMHGR